MGIFGPNIQAVMRNFADRQGGKGFSSCRVTGRAGGLLGPGHLQLILRSRVSHIQQKVFATQSKRKRRKNKRKKEKKWRKSWKINMEENTAKYIIMFEII